MNQVREEILIHGVRWARNILIELEGVDVGEEAKGHLRVAIRALEGLNESLGKESSYMPYGTEPSKRKIKAYLMESSDKEGSPLNVLVMAETHEKAHEVFEKNFGDQLYEKGEWGSTNVPLRNGTFFKL